MPEPTEPASQPELQKPIGEFVQKTADEVRKQPVKSLVWAFFVGVFALIRPILLLLGAVKLCEEIEMRRK
jgi:hypothetical protein